LFSISVFGQLFAKPGPSTPPTGYLDFILTPFLVCFFLGGCVFGALGASGRTLPENFQKRYGSPLWYIWLGLPFFLFFLLVVSLDAGLSIERLILNYYLIGLFLGFAFRERFRVDKVPLSVWNQIAFCLVLALPLCHAGHEIRKDASYTKQRGHGFEHAGGFSDSDLKPYDPRIPGSIVARLSAPATFTLKGTDKLPVLNGAQAAFPVYAAFANACYLDLAPLSQKEINWYDHHPPNDSALMFTNTIYGFQSLVEGKADIFFGAHPSDVQMELARTRGKELTLTPIGKEAFVFFVNETNPVNALSSEQIRRIYSGAIDNWKEVGGNKKPIIAFQRPENSGSQTIMLRFMGKTPLPPPLMDRRSRGMGGILEKVSEYRNAPSAIGYSFRFFLTGMGKQPRVKMLSVDGVPPTLENIASRKYPIVVNLYAVTVKGNPNPNVMPFVKWMTGEQGQELIEKTGYARLRQTAPRD
jgi:phosphate transport system substrate-binding protein